MLNPNTMSPMQEQEARNKAFYLIKKYTSYTFLDYARKLNQQFLDAFERQLRNPSLDFLQSKDVEYFQKHHEGQYVYFLERMARQEQGLSLLKNSKHKSEAYELCIADFKGRLFGRYADEIGLDNDPFYQLMGLGHEYSGNLFLKNDHFGYIRDVLIASEMVSTLLISISGDDSKYFIPEEDRLFEKWTYETLFYKPLLNGLQWPLSRFYPQSIMECPPFNESSIGEIANGEEIIITGIYEPWLPITGKVGCPNYFLEGTIATDYQLEGTDEWADVKWRLIWEDKRYLDGTIPEEEKAYIFDSENIDIKDTYTYASSPEKLSIRAGQVCPKSGYWFTVAQENSRQYFKQGEVLPEIKSDWGEVYWQFDGK